MHEVIQQRTGVITAICHNADPDGIVHATFALSSLTLPPKAHAQHHLLSNPQVPLGTLAERPPRSRRTPNLKAANEGQGHLSNGPISKSNDEQPLQGIPSALPSCSTGAREGGQAFFVICCCRSRGRVWPATCRRPVLCEAGAVRQECENHAEHSLGRMSVPSGKMPNQGPSLGPRP